MFEVCEPGRTYLFQPHSPLSSFTDSSGVVTSSHWSRAPVDEVTVIAGEPGVVTSSHWSGALVDEVAVIAGDEPGVGDSRVVSTVGLLALATNRMEAHLLSLYVLCTFVVG